MYSGNRLKGFDLDVSLFSELRCLPSVTIDINLSCVLNRHKLRQSQIATLLSQFVICRKLWSKPWRHKLSPITLITCSGYLGEYPGWLLTLLWKVVFFFFILVLFHWYILFMCMPISYKAYTRCTQEIAWKGPILMWICFLNLGVYPRLILISIWEVVFWTVTNCDTIVAICDLSQFVIKAVTAQTESNTTENVFWVLGRVPRFTFDINMKSCIFVHFGVISLVYLFMCMHISYKAINRCTQELSWKGPILIWACVLNLGVYPRLLLISIWEVVFWTVTNCDSHKLRHYRHNLWFVAICDQSRDGTHWVQ